MNNSPLAEILRPKTLDDVLGQEHLTGKNGTIKRMLDNDTINSLIFWGPPGTGKTTLAEIISEKSGRKFYKLSAVSAGVKDVRDIIDEAKKLGRPTMIIFFGDHLPNLGEVFDQFGFYANAEEKAQKNNAKFFSTPLAVWSNFEINRSEFSNSASNSIIPAHFLHQKVLRAAHLPSSPYYDFMNSVQECYSQIHQTGSPSNQACDQQKIEVLQQYKDLNMDVINGKNFSYELLKSHRIS